MKKRKKKSFKYFIGYKDDEKIKPLRMFFLLKMKNYQNHIMRYGQG